ncbi:hypothetical protein [Bradyrhizobium diazoefficiens]|uniref:hypothetical protein n=1 Tax=Bradyrhizobium diazoefficiens TaxID=1355477 RepID=UPI0004B59F28|nr:hypothetical protein [Bradyrhizobium diazoefficiens]QLD41969.1 hypothetical protein HUW42_13650 [Bradyrhizobium diazoefficiens]WLB36478.1 hypothetical protein QIH78_34145 [Bradyrhizobium diazoefficiens]WLC18521.1 hypothetical protein QIH76_09480 [Bradyrhizobium diazoefficiens]
MIYCSTLLDSTASAGPIGRFLIPGRSLSTEARTGAKFAVEPQWKLSVGMTEANVQRSIQLSALARGHSAAAWNGAAVRRI